MKKYIFISIIILFFIIVAIFVLRKSDILLNNNISLLPVSERKILGYPQDFRRGGSFPSGNKDYYFSYNNIAYYHVSDRALECMGCEDTNEKDIKLNNSDPDSFIIIDSNYAKDKNNVYYWGAIVEKADPATFQPLDWPKAKDKNYYFSQTEITGKIK